MTAVDFEGKVNQMNSVAEATSVESNPLEVISPSFEGDPPEIEEDGDFRENNIDGVMSSNKNIILRLLSQIRIGMDLTRIALPIFIFEKRSLLEMYAEFFAHPDLALRCYNLDNPLDRMIEVTRWFLSSLSASRKDIGIPQKPYNPVLGEVFSCYWDVPGGKRTAPSAVEMRIMEGGPALHAGYDSLAFMAEQVSHHPPVTAFYAECPSKRFYFTATVETKTRFTGRSVKVLNCGTFELHYIDRNEVYIGNFPNGYVRSLLSKPWFEFGGISILTCERSGYTANIEFHTKPFRGGQKHRITADIRNSNLNNSELKLDGHWNTVIMKKISNTEMSQFIDVRLTPTIRKKVRKISLQEKYESRVVWRNVTMALEKEDSEAATAAKRKVEDVNREKARECKLKGQEWQAKFFTRGVKNGMPFWSFKKNLKERVDEIS